MQQNLSEFLDKHRSTRKVIEVDANRDTDGMTPFIIVRAGQFTAIINPMVFDDHLSIDVRPFLDGEGVTAGAFGMSDGKRAELGDELGTTSHGWHSARLVAVLIGEQGNDERAEQK